MSPSATTGDDVRTTSQRRVPFLQQSYDSKNSVDSATKLILCLRPEWATGDNKLEFVRFTDGITNTLLKAVNRRPGSSDADIDKEAILLRAYGNGTDVLIDREREAANHELLMQHGLAPDLLARFQNGMLYRFVSGAVAQPSDLSDPQVSRAVATRLAEWHANIPCIPDASLRVGAQLNGNAIKSKIANAAPGKPSPNVWTTMQKWLLALPSETEAQRKRQALLQQEFELLVQKLSSRPGYGRNGLVFAHCDLLCANIIMHKEDGRVESVSFIDYEYGTPSPAAFDIANHFAEWAGYDCDYSAVPNVSQRRIFIEEYVSTYRELAKKNGTLATDSQSDEEDVLKLLEEVDIFRGVPGFYWGIWALIQSTISFIDFDYANYAEERLGEYWAFKAEENGSRKASGRDMPLRESTWSHAE